MFSLADVLDTELMRRASPVIRAGEQLVATAQVRWVHSSEVLEIAPLLRGQELLLSGGDALHGLKPDAQYEYIRSLAERHVTALAIQTAGSDRALSADLVLAAEAVGLPLIELRSVVPFVEIAEDVNSRLVSHQVMALQTADSISQQLAAKLASSGPNLLALVEVISEALQIETVLLDPSGAVLELAGKFSPDETSEEVDIDIFVGSLVSARLRMQSRPGVDATLLKTVGERVSSILALALAQHYSPTASQIADAALMRAIIGGAGAAQLQELCAAVGLPVDQPVFMMVFRRIGLNGVRGVAERMLRIRCPGVRTHLDGENLCALVQLSISGTRQERRAIVEGLRADFHGLAVAGAIGPTMATMFQAHSSLAEAKLTQSVGAPDDFDGHIRDCEDFLLERLAIRELSAAVIDRITQEVLGELMDYDRRRGTRLLNSLDAWLLTGCNSAATARTLFIERQTLHKRLQKIFDLIGGDPRGSAKMPGLYLAVRLAVNPLPAETA